jgi:hypothetical protein
MLIFSIVVDILLLQLHTAEAFNIEIFRTANRFNNFTERDIVGPLNGGPNSIGCYATSLKVGTTNFNLFLDSGSSNLIIPGTGLNAYTGAVYNTVGKTSTDGKSYSGTFTGGSTWTGKIYRDNVTLGGNTVNASFIAINIQSATVPVANTERQGILGIAYDSLGIHPNLLTTLFTSGKINNKVVAFRGCAEGSTKQSIANWGGQDPALTCSPGGVPEVWVKVTTPSFYNFKVFTVKAGSTSLGTWTSTNAVYLDSCTTVTLLPTSFFNALVTVLTANTVLKNFLTAIGTTPASLLVNYGCVYNMGTTVLNYGSLPSLSFTVQGMNNQNVTINLGPSGYIQQQDYGGFSSLCFMVASTTINRITLGTTFFEQFYVVLDQDNNRVGFGKGCSCNEPSTMHPYLSSLSSTGPTNVTVQAASSSSAAASGSSSKAATSSLASSVAVSSRSSSKTGTSSLAFSSISKLSSTSSMSSLASSVLTSRQSSSSVLLSTSPTTTSLSTILTVPSSFSIFSSSLSNSYTVAPSISSTTALSSPSIIQPYLGIY